ncbi:hypothetical protein PHYPSEUDO_002422 [Phytophthora pseudosyringae]|uniref:Uncharacterized protein n=1 Tax=Phytophthora pseudosyringae TaxID=221518 RepID=A0A8T1V6M7_9STRA|nr:hypothetical protein PHYPSEUDO_002422 [Phytophthora pseudosyringae]
MTDVHAAWLRAGASGDAAAMRQLYTQFPEWLDLQRSVGPATANSTSRARSCSWTDFHLRTIGASSIHTAAWNGELAILRFLLEAGQSPDTLGNEGVTPTMVAILRLTLMTMRCMIRGGEAIKRNILVDCRKEEGEQRVQVIAVIDLLFSFGADVNAHTQEGKTALHLSTSDDAYEVAKHLLDADANIDTQDESGKTALHYCVYEAGLLVTNLLLSRGANIDIEDGNGLTPLALAVQRANLNVLQLFMNHHDWVATPERHDFGGAVMLQAVECEQESVVRFLVDNDYAPVTVRNSKGETPMHRAILRRNPAMMELLLDLDRDGDNMTAVNRELETPAHYAARYGSHREVQTLLQCLMSALGDLQELPELGVENPLNAVDGKGTTSLYATGTASSDGRYGLEEGVAGADPTCSQEVRDAKAQLLLDHGALLFAPGFLTEELARGTADSSSHLVLPVQVQKCLQRWLTDPRTCNRDPAEQQPCDGDPHQSGEFPLEALTEICMRWITMTSYSGSPLILVASVTCAGYSHEVLPLLVGLPIHCDGFPSWLRQLEKYARHGAVHPFLLQLSEELATAWNSLAALGRRF